jgi:hypothetical protein
MKCIIYSSSKLTCNFNFQNFFQEQYSYTQSCNSISPCLEIKQYISYRFCYNSWRSGNKAVQYFSLTVDKRVISSDWDILSCVSLRNWYHSIYPLCVLNYTRSTSTVHPSWHANTNRRFLLKQWTLWLNCTIGFHVCLNFETLFIVFLFLST